MALHGGHARAGSAGPGHRPVEMLAAKHKIRIKDLVRQLMPCSPLTGDLGMADLAVLDRWADPRALLAAGLTRLTRVIGTASTVIKAPIGPSSGGRPRPRRCSCTTDTRGRVHRPGRRGPDRGSPAAGHRGRAGRPRGRTRKRLTIHRSGRVGEVPAGCCGGRRVGVRPVKDLNADRVVNRPGRPIEATRAVRDREHRPRIAKIHGTIKITTKS